MRVFYGAQLVERGPQLPIRPVSFGFVTEDGRELYVINEECLSDVMRDARLSINIAPSLPIQDDQRGVGHFITQWNPEHPDYADVLALDFLVQQVHEFLKSVPDPQLWAHYSAFSHVALSQLFGSIADVPPGIPMFTHELQQVIEANPDVNLPPAPSEHHALLDAHWSRDVFSALTSISQDPETSIRREWL